MQFLGLPLATQYTRPGIGRLILRHLLRSLAVDGNLLDTPLPPQQKWRDSHRAMQKSFFFDS